MRRGGKGRKVCKWVGITGRFMGGWEHPQWIALRKKENWVDLR